MEIIKKTILRKLTTGIPVPCSRRDRETGILITGCTATTKPIVPETNSGVTYNIKIKLTGIQKDIGFFDAYTLGGNVSGSANDVDYGGYTYTPLVVTGTSTSRLSELRKYTVTTVFANQYVVGGNSTTDGVDLLDSSPPEIVVYFIGGIRYVDISTGDTSGTTFSFIAQGIDSPDFIDVPIYKDPKKDNIISNPKIIDDVFIVRQELSAFDKNYKLEYIKNLNDLLTYAGGNFFKIVNNS